MARHGASVLLVDDDPLVLMNHSDILEDAGYLVSRAEGVGQGWNVFQSRPFDVMVCDHDLGDGKGWDLVRKLQGSGGSVPVVYLSAALPKTLEEAAALPLVKRVLAKPVSKDALLEAVGELAQRGGGLDSKYPKLVGDEERRMLLDAISLKNE